MHFESEDIAIASVNDTGLVKAKGNGTTNIVVSSIYDENVFAKFQITSRGVSLQNFKLTTKLIHLNVGQSKKIKKAVYPSNTSNKDAIFTSSDESVATVDENGLVYAEDVGNAVITAVSEDKGIIDTCNVTVVDEGEMTKTELNYTIKDYVDTIANDTMNGCSPSTGNVYIIVLPIAFSDTDLFITDMDQVRQDIETLYFGTNEETGWRSVKTFYEEESFGALRIDGIVGDWYNCGRSYDDFGIDDNDETGLMIEDALADFKRNHKDLDWSLYDQDRDGYIDNVCCVYGAPSYTALKKNDYTNLWSYQGYRKNQPQIGNPVMKYYTFSTYCSMYTSKETALAHTGKSNHFEGMGTCTIDAHVFIHESGHMFGLIDYYDLGYETKPTGGSGMQDGDAFMHDPFSGIGFGWDQPYIPTKSCEIRLNNFVDSGDCILLSPRFNSEKSPFDEYFLVSVFSPTKINEYDMINNYYNSGDFTADDYGVQIWHVDARLAKWTGEYNIDNLTVIPSREGNSGVRLAFNNNSSASPEGWICPVGIDYCDYNLLYLVRNYPDLSFNNNYYYNGPDLFREGDVFTMDKFSTQFPNGNKMDNGSTLGWQVEVASLDREGATIALTRI